MVWENRKYESSNTQIKNQFQYRKFLDQVHRKVEILIQFPHLNELVYQVHVLFILLIVSIFVKEKGKLKPNKNGSNCRPAIERKFKSNC